MIRFLVIICLIFASSAAAQERIVSSRDNLVPFTAEQLSQMGYVKQSQGYWMRPVMTAEGCEATTQPVLSKQ